MCCWPERERDWFWWLQGSGGELPVSSHRTTEKKATWAIPSHAAPIRACQSHVRGPQRYMSRGQRALERRRRRNTFSRTNPRLACRSEWQIPGRKVTAGCLGWLNSDNHHPKEALRWERPKGVGLPCRRGLFSGLDGCRWLKKHDRQDWHLRHAERCCYLPNGVSDVQGGDFQESQGRGRVRGRG